MLNHRESPFRFTDREDPMLISMAMTQELGEFFFLEVTFIQDI